MNGMIFLGVDRAKFNRAMNVIILPSIVSKIVDFIMINSKRKEGMERLKQSLTTSQFQFQFTSNAISVQKVNHLITNQLLFAYLIT